MAISLSLFDFDDNREFYTNDWVIVERASRIFRVLQEHVALHLSDLS